MEESKIELINPIEGQNTHIQSHKEINAYIAQFYNHLNNIESTLEGLRDVDEKFSSAFSEIRELKKDVKELSKTLGKTVNKIEMLEEKVNKPKKYLVKTFEGILDTDTESLATLETIELDGTYLVQIVENEVVSNPEVASYSLGRTAIANKEYTPGVYLLSKGGHAVLEYDFTVILTEI